MTTGILMSYGMACLVTMIQVFVVCVVFATVLFLFGLVAGGRKSEAGTVHAPPGAPAFAASLDVSGLPSRSVEQSRLVTLPASLRNSTTG